MTSFWDRFSERQMALLVLAFGLLLYVPFAGSYGLWDPWETHYGEVARQMTARGDFVSLWWPGSPRESAVFQTKPVLSFWLMALSMRLLGVGADASAPGEMALGTRAEWAVRLPFCLLAALGLYAVFLVTARFAGRRAGVLAAIVTGTCPLYLLVARQAMTDMAFVAPMAMALAVATLALFSDDDGEAPLARRGRGPLSWPAIPLFGGAVALFVLATVPQLTLYSTALRVHVPWGGRTVTMYGAVAMLPYWLAAVVVIAGASRLRHRAPLLFLVAGTLAGLAILGKGLAGLALPGTIFVVFLLATGSWRRLARAQRLWGLALALLACAVVAVPWHHAMIIRHGWQWWTELFGDNHWRRLMIGRHGDRGTFEYFLRELGHGVLPWIALAPAALVSAVVRRGSAPAAASRTDDPRGVCLALGAVWLVCSYAIVSLSMTKFHHYVLPAIPGFGIVIGCLLDELLGNRGRLRAALPLVGVPLLAVVAFDLFTTQNAPQRFLWLFSYDYVHNPRGRPWPEAVDFRAPVAAFVALFAVTTALAAALRSRRAGVAALAGSAVLFTWFLLDVYMPTLAPYWSQKPALAAYYRERRDPGERLVAYKMFWRGETFYTKNAIFSGADEERTVFDSDGTEADDRLRAWVAARAGQRHYFLFERGREAHLRALLSPRGQATLQIVDQPNTKFALARADL